MSLSLNMKAYEAQAADIKYIIESSNTFDELLSYAYKKTNRWLENSNHDSKWIYYNGGNVAIGNTIPTASLDIYTNVLINYDMKSINSIKTNNNVWTNLGIITSSDERIKKNIIDVSDSRALESILKIEPKKYNYIESGKKQNIYGFIAQQVADIIPNAVQLKENFIPNIYSNGFIEDNVLTVEGSNFNVMKGDILLIINHKNEGIIKKVNDIEFTDCLKIKIEHGLCGNVFVYGIMVKDFHVLDKSYIYTLNVGALQELASNYADIDKQIDDICNHDNKINSSIIKLTSNMYELSEIPNYQELYDYKLIDDVNILKQNNDILMKRVIECDDTVYVKLQKELEMIEYENAVLLSSNLIYMNEYNTIIDAININMNEVITIKNIMNMNDIII